MIINRIARAFRDQDWFVVFLEILIVVVGIYLGLQVDEWNEERKHRQEERVYLEKIHDDLISMQQDILGKYEGYESRITSMIRALDALEACDTSPEATEAMKRSIEVYQAAPPIDYLGATYDEMVSTGALARIANQPLKSAIAKTFSNLSTLGVVMRGYRISLPVVDEIVWKYASFSIDRETRRHVATVDIATLCDNLQVRNAVVEMIDIQKDGQNAMNRANESVTELLQLLSEHQN